MMVCAIITTLTVLELTDEQYEAFVSGELYEMQIDEIDLAGMFDLCRICEAEETTDYSICDENGDTIVPWSD